LPAKIAHQRHLFRINGIDRSVSDRRNSVCVLMC
jgi:hypothetical protein